MAMQAAPHPGGVVRRQCLEPLGLTVTEAAKGLGVTRQALSDLVNEKAGISVEMAIRLSKAFGSSPETWLGLQMAYDLWQARGRAEEIEVRDFRAAKDAGQEMAPDPRGQAQPSTDADSATKERRPDGFDQSLAAADEVRERIRRWQKAHGIEPQDTVLTMRRLREGRDEDLAGVR